MKPTVTDKDKSPPKKRRVKKARSSEGQEVEERARYDLGNVDPRPRIKREDSLGFYPEIPPVYTRNVNAGQNADSRAVFEARSQAHRPPRMSSESTLDVSHLPYVPAVPGHPSFSLSNIAQSPAENKASPEECAQHVPLIEEDEFNAMIDHQTATSAERINASAVQDRPLTIDAVPQHPWRATADPTVRLPAIISDQVRFDIDMPPGPTLIFVVRLPAAGLGFRFTAPVDWTLEAVLSAGISGAPDNYTMERFVERRRVTIQHPALQVPVTFHLDAARASAIWRAAMHIIHRHVENLNLEARDRNIVVELYFTLDF